MKLANLVSVITQASLLRFLWAALFPGEPAKWLTSVWKLAKHKANGYNLMGLVAG